jgi:hypothetical protein
VEAASVLFLQGESQEFESPHLHHLFRYKTPWLVTRGLSVWPLNAVRRDSCLGGRGIYSREQNRATGDDAGVHSVAGFLVMAPFEFR